MASQPVSPLNLDRYELKYRIHSSLIDPISEYVAHYCDMDYYSQISPNGFYIINSLYLDSPSLYIYNRRETMEFDYSCFRIRSYGAQPKAPYYFESKQKVRDFCKKRRGKVPIENFGDLLDDRTKVAGFDPYACKNTRDFIEKTHTFGLRPTVLTQYRRRAFLSRHDDYARVTFDRDMKYQEESEWNVHPDESRMTNYDNPEAFEDYNSGRHCVLELKCERKIPLWLIQLIRTFQLSHMPFSKYQGSILEHFGRADEQSAFDRIPRWTISGGRRVLF